MFLGHADIFTCGNYIFKNALLMLNSNFSIDGEKMVIDCNEGLVHDYSQTIMR